MRVIVIQKVVFNRSSCHPPKPGMLMKKMMATLLISTTSLSFAGDCPEVLDFSAQRLRPTENIEFCDAFAGKALLVVNTANPCGFTPQFQEL